MNLLPVLGLSDLKYVVVDVCRLLVEVTVTVSEGGREVGECRGGFRCEGFTLNPPHHFYDYAIRL